MANLNIVREEDDFDFPDDDNIENIMNRNKMVDRSDSHPGSVVSNRDRDFFIREEKNDMDYDDEEDHDDNNYNSNKKSLGDGDQSDVVSSYAGSEMDDEEVMKKKYEYIHEIEKLISRGVKTNYVPSVHKDLKELKFQYLSLQKTYDVGECYDFMKMGLNLTCSGIEAVVTSSAVKDNIYEVRLKGWAEAVRAATEDNQNKEIRPILEDLYEKHYDKLSGFSPEAKLAMFLGKTAAQHHIINSMFSGEDIKKDIKEQPGFEEDYKILIEKYSRKTQEKMFNASSAKANNMFGKQQAPPPPVREMNGPDVDVDELMNMSFNNDSLELF